MAKTSEGWASKPEAWVMLKDLLIKIEQEIGIAPDDAVTALRHPLECCAIQTVVVGWDPRPISMLHARFFNRPAIASTFWTREIGQSGSYCVSEEGWKYVDWEAGTLIGCPVLVNWADVLRELTPLATVTSVLRRLPPEPSPRASRPKPTLNAVREWIRHRVAAWPDKFPAPSEQTDWDEIRAHFREGMRRDDFRQIRAEETPPEWRTRGPRKAWGLVKSPGPETAKKSAKQRPQK